MSNLGARKKTWKKMTIAQLDSADWVLRVIYSSTALRGAAKQDVEMIHAELRDEYSRRVKEKAK